jgi:hypothetical protein
MGRLTANGMLVLARVGRYFDVEWSRLDNSPQQHVEALIRNPGRRSDVWGFGMFMKSDCSQIASFSLTPDHDDLLLTFTHSKHPLQRIFRLLKSSFLGTFRSIEQLLVDGIAVPSRTDATPYLLQFYSRANIETCQMILPHIQLHSQGFQAPDGLRLSLRAFFLRIIASLDGTDALPRDHLFPLADAANYEIFEKANAFASELPALDRSDHGG